MKIILINPPTTNIMRTNDCFYSLSSVNFVPPINLLYPATIIKRKTDYDVKIIDADIEQLDYVDIEKRIEQEKPDVVGVTAYTMAFYDCLQTIRAVKRAAPNSKICVGGNLTKYYPWELLEFHPEIEYVFLGDAEYSFTELLIALDKNMPLEEVKGIMYRKGEEIIVTGPPNQINNLDELPFPDLRLIDHMKYLLSVGTSEPLAVIMGSRGCPFQCNFCQSANTRYRLRSINSILNEVKYYLDYGIKEIVFYDDTFNITPQRVIDFSKGVIERGYKIKWSFRGRIELVSDEMFKIAKEAGLILMTYGVEDASDEGLAYTQRRQTLEQVFNGTALAKDNNIPISVNFIIGLPQHKTKEDILRVINLAKKLNPAYCQFSIFTPHIGTVFYQNGVDRGILDGDYWRSYIKHPWKNADVQVWEEHFSKSELNSFFRQAHMSFYFSPRYIIRTVLSVNSFKELSAKMHVGFGLFKRVFIKPISSK